MNNEISVFRCQLSIDNYQLLQKENPLPDGQRISEYDDGARITS